MKNLERDHVYLLVILAIAAFLRIYEFIGLSPPAINIDEYVLSKIFDLIIIGLVYGLTSKVMKSRKAGLFAAALSVGVPLYNWGVAFELYHTLALFLYLLTLYILVSVNEMEDWWFGLFVPLILAFIHIYGLFLVAALFLFIFFVELERLKFSKKELYFIGMTSFIAVIIFLSFSITPALLLVIKQYINIGYYTIGSENFTLIKALSIAGTLPIYIGVIGAYYSIKKRSKYGLIFMGTSGVFLGGMLFNIIPISLGLPYLILSLAVFSGFVYEKFVRLVGVSRFKKYKTAILFLLFIVVLLIESGHWILSSV